LRPVHERAHRDTVSSPAHRRQLASLRTVLTHMSDDMLDHLDQACFDTAEDGLVLHI
jgi:hypothetical protein